MTLPAVTVQEFRGAPRRGVAALTRLAYAGNDLLPLYASLTRGCYFKPEAAGDVMDLAMLSQLLGDPGGGRKLQTRILECEQLYRLENTPHPARLRLLCFAADMDIGGNTPVEFLVGDSIEVMTLYLREGDALPAALPDHDVAMVIMPDDERCAAALARLEAALADWPRPVINLPSAIRNLDRHRLFRVLKGIDGAVIPETLRVRRADATGLYGQLGLRELIVRPTGSHAGRGLARISDDRQWTDYLAASEADELFVSPFIDYRSGDGLFRKYRVVLAGGRPYPVHMAIGPDWKLWYLNAEMEQNPGRRAEEQAFMDQFRIGFGKRHHAALAEIARRTGLDYVGLDCAETRDGSLLVFEADNTLIVHDMDSPSVFPYKAGHMQNLFDAFQAMLFARKHRDCKQMEVASG